MNEEKQVEEIKKLEVEEKLLMDILNYLATKPYAEVYGLIGRLQMLTYKK